MTKRKNPKGAKTERVLAREKWLRIQSGNPENETLTPREKSLAQLQPLGSWKAGEVTNPKGRTPGSFSFKETLLKYLKQHPEEGEEIIVALVKQGKIGNVIATKEMMDRVDGKVAETHKIEGVLPVTLLFRPAEEVLALNPPGVIDGEVREITDGEETNNV